MATGSSRIDYEALQQEAMRGVVRLVLKEVATNGLPGEHHFYISFLTTAPGVLLSKRLKEKYPHEMTIVLQHRFWDMVVTDERFEVNLTFDGIPERLIVPYSAIKVFIDPSVRYGLQFDDHVIDREPGAPRHELTMDAAYDSVGNLPGETPRNVLPKKPRAPRKSKSDKPSLTVPAAASRNNLPVAPAPEPASAAATGKSADHASDEQPKTGGAKILSLDRFRKK